MQSITRRRPILGLLLLSSATLLTACGANEPRIRTKIVIREKMVFVEPDPTLRSCMARLERRPVNSDADIAKLIADSFEVGDDCRSKLNATWKSIDDTRARVEAFNRAQEAQQQ